VERGTELTNFGTDQVKEIFRKLSASSKQAEILQKLESHLKESLNEIVGTTLFYDEEKGLLLKGGIPNVSFRIETIRLLFDGFFQKIKQDERNRLLRDLGHGIGQTFGRDMLKWLTKCGWNPNNYQTVLEFWTLYDSTAGWGKTSLASYDNLKATVEVDQSYLVQVDPDHVYCEFLSGYISGLVWEAFSQWAQNRETGPEVKITRLIPKSVTHDSRGKECQFIIELTESSLRKTRDRLTKIWIELEHEKLGAAESNPRNLLEYALKEKMGEDPELHSYSFSVLRSAYRKCGIDLPYAEYRHFYDELSRRAHWSKVKDVVNLVVYVSGLIHDLDAKEVSAEQKSIIRKAAEELRTKESQGASIA